MGVGVELDQDKVLKQDWVQGGRWEGKGEC